MCNRGPSITMDHMFYEETLQHWSELQEAKVPTAKIICNLTIWDNTYITIQNRLFLWRLCQKKAIEQVYIIRDDGDFLDHNEIKKIFDINRNVLNVLQISQNPPLNWRKLIKKKKAVTTKVSVPFVDFCGKPTPLVTVAANILYNQFIKNKYRKTSWLTEMAVNIAWSDTGRGMARYP